MSLLKLTVDRQNETLVALNGTPTSMPALFQYNLKPMQIQVVDPTGNFNTPYSAVDLSTYSLRVGIWPTPTGTAGGPASLALQTTWTWNSAGKYFAGTLDLSSTAIETYIGTDASKSADFEITLSLAGDKITLFQGTVILKAVGDEGTASSLSTADTYLTKAESLAKFLPRVTEAGATLVIVSPSGVYGLELRCNDDGTVGQNVITL